MVGSLDVGDTCLCPGPRPCRGPSTTGYVVVEGTVVEDVVGGLPIRSGGRELVPMARAMFAISEKLLRA